MKSFHELRPAENAGSRSMSTSETMIQKGGMMSTPTKSEYMLLFRGTDWHKGLSPEELQQVVNRMKAWFDRLTAEGKAKAGKPLFVGVGVCPRRS